MLRELQSGFEIFFSPTREGGGARVWKDTKKLSESVVMEVSSANKRE